MDHKDIITGTVYKLDQKISAKDIARNQMTESYHKLSSIVPFQGIIPHFADDIFMRNILVAEENFGFGSSKEIAALILKRHGVQVIIARDFFPTFYKNAFNIGLLCLSANTAYFDDQDDLIIDVKQGYIQNRTKKLGIKFKPLKKYFYRLYKSEGLFPQLIEKERKQTK